VGRDQFWELLIRLARKEGVTIFISTHFMNEAERCDRIALMHAGRVLACDVPRALTLASGKKTLEECFIAHLEAAAPAGAASAPVPVAAVACRVTEKTAPDPVFSARRLAAYLLREILELRRDPVRLSFALLGPVLLMLVLGYGITFDVENLSYAVLDHDQTTTSREYLENFAGSRYFRERAPIKDYDDMDHRMQSGELRVAIEIPTQFAKNLKRGRNPEVGVWIDGAMPFRAETTRGYVQGLHQSYLSGLPLRFHGATAPTLPADLQFRYRYNQSFKSIYAMVPGVIGLLLVFFPSILMALGVVREKEHGSITNLYATPVTRLEFLLGKQLPYVAVGMINFFTLAAMAVWLFEVPLKAGLMPLAFTKTQLAALFGTAIFTVMPAVQFSGLLSPVSSLTGSAAFIGTCFPSTYFMRISVGTFTKALGFADLARDYAALAFFIPILTLLSLKLLKKQET
jgi:ribosome-dependent ATPase